MDDTRQPCIICGNPLTVSWTDTHGIAACVTCNATFRIYHYEGDPPRRVDKPPTCLVLYEWVEPLRRFWRETGKRIPHDLSISGYGTSYCRHTTEDGQAFDEWLRANKGSLPEQTKENA